MSVPGVSVVIPTYNRRERVCGAIRSVLDQTHADFELIVVDDGSSDGSAQHLRDTFGSDARVGVFTKPNGGSASARNFGVDKARAEWVAYLDDDDRWLPQWLESQLACAARHPEADLVVCDARYEGDWKAGRTTVFSRGSYRTPDSIEAMCNGAWALPSCMLIRAQVARVLPWDGTFKYAEDTAFLFHFNERSFQLVENPDVLTRYIKHAGGDGTPQKIDCGDQILLDHLALLEAFADRTTEPHNVRYQIDRKKARYFARHGRWREVRPHAWAWLKARPTSLRAWRFTLRSLFARTKRA